jgi:tRNA-modifying protein YgfZ
MSSPLREKMIRAGALFPAGGSGLPRSFGDPVREAAAAPGGCALADRSDLGFLTMRGKDRQDFLHRLSTQEINALKPGDGNLTALLNTRGRVLDLLHALADETELLLITSPGTAGKVRLWLEGYIFREEVALEEPGGLGCLGLYGPGSAAILSRISGSGWDRLQTAHHRTAEIAGLRCRVARTFPLAGSGFLLMCDSEPAPLWDLLTQAGAAPAGAEALEILRVEAGVPGIGAELTEDHNPWEVGLGAAVSLTKGCYLGQEVVARLHNYRKVQRSLAGIRFVGNRRPGPGAPVLSGDETLGVVTSSSPSSRENESLALCLLPPAAARPGQAVTAGEGSDRIAGVTRSLPFLQGE